MRIVLQLVVDCHVRLTTLTATHIGNFFILQLCFDIEPDLKPKAESRDNHGDNQQNNFDNGRYPLLHRMCH